MNPIAFALLAAVTAAPSADGLLDLSGPAYLEARARVLAEGPARTTTARPTYTAANWKRPLLQDALQAHRDAPELAQTTAKIPGVDPEVYRKLRAPRPSATRDVRTWPAVAVLEQLVFVRRQAPRAADGETQSRRDAEALAVRHALVMAAGRSGHPAARFALAEVLADAGEALTIRAAAARALGSTQDPDVVGLLKATLHDERHAMSVREAALVGLGSLRVPESLDELVTRTDPEGSWSHVAIAAIGRLGSARRCPPELRARAAAALKGALLDSRFEARRVAEALGRTADRPTLDALQAIAEDVDELPERRARAAQGARRLRRVLGRRGAL